MIQQFIRQVGGLLLCFLVMIAAAPATAQQAPRRIVAVGDLHGDYESWLAIARAAGLVNSSNRWAGGATTLVQLGDVTDRGPDSLKIIGHLRQLQRSAPRSGGRVITLVGNHEAMNLTGDLRYVDPGEFAAFAGRESRGRSDEFYTRNRGGIEASYRAQNPNSSAEQIRAAWEAEHPPGWVEHQIAWRPSSELGRWTIGNPAVVKIGATLFVHGGLSAEYATVPIEQINQRIADALRRRDEGETSIINDPLGPLWYRGLIARNLQPETERAPTGSAAPARPRPPIEQELDAVLRAYGARRIVVGHTPSVQGIAIRHGGKLVQVDTGNSRAYKGRPSYLEIFGDRLVPHIVQRPGERAR